MQRGLNRLQYGDQLSYEKWNALVDEVKRLGRIEGDSSIHIDQDACGVQLRFVGSTGGDTDIRFTLTQDTPKGQLYITTNAVTWNGKTYTSGGSPILIYDPNESNGPGVVGGTFTAQVTNGQLTGITIQNGGSGYASPATVQITGGGGSQAQATAQLNSAGQVVGFSITAPGNNYTSAPTIQVNNSTPGATAGYPGTNYSGQIHWAKTGYSGLARTAGDRSAYEVVEIQHVAKYITCTIGDLPTVNAPTTAPTVQVVGAPGNLTTGTYQYALVATNGTQYSPISPTATIAVNSPVGGQVQLTFASGTYYVYRTKANGSDLLRVGLATGTTFIDNTPDSQILGSPTTGTALSQPAAPQLSIYTPPNALDGDYLYRVTFLTAAGETPAGPESLMASPSDQYVYLSKIPTATDPTVWGRNIYRTPATGISNSERWLATIDDNFTSTFLDTIPDANLGAKYPTTNSSGSSNSASGMANKASILVPQSSVGSAWDGLNPSKGPLAITLLNTADLGWQCPSGSIVTAVWQDQLDNSTSWQYQVIDGPY